MVHQIVLKGQLANSLQSFAIVFIVAMIWPLSGFSADSWEPVRKFQIDPLNSMLHDHWPRELKEGDLDVLMRLYAIKEGPGITWADPELVSGPGTEMTLRWSEEGTESI